MDVLHGEYSEALLGLLEKCAHMDAPATAPEHRALMREIVETARTLDLIEALSFPGTFEKELASRSEAIFQAAKAFHEEIESVEVAISEGRKMLDDVELNLDCDVVDRIVEHGKLLATHSKCPPFWAEGAGLGSRFPAYPTEELIQRSLLRSKIAPSPPQTPEPAEPSEAAKRKESFTFEI